jgi:RNA polymerase sigma-70 factor (ECF subfamily)
MEPAPDAQLVCALKAGDPAAFDAIYDALRARLYSFLLRLSRRHDVAEDLLEETWLRLVTHAHGLSDDTCLPAWLFTVARNLYASWCRHRAVDESRISELTPSWPAPGRGESPFDAAARTETEHRLEMALARLSHADREAVLLVGSEGFTPSQAAEIIGLPGDAFRKRLQRARQRLAIEMNATSAGHLSAPGHRQ